MQTSINTDILECRNRKRYYSVMLGIWVVIIAAILLIPHTGQSNINFIFKNFKPAKLPLFILIFGVPLYILYAYLDNSIKVKIDKEGIWTPKLKTLAWADLWYFYTIVSSNREGPSYCLFVRLKEGLNNGDDPLEISLNQLDKNFKEIRNTIEKYASQNNIEDLGHEDKR